jgi:hypothetical protein
MKKSQRLHRLSELNSVASVNTEQLKLETNMAKWHLEERMQSLGSRRFPHFLLVGDNGAAVRMDFARGWFLEYQGEDFDVRFSVYRDPPSGGDTDMVLGPHCAVKINFSKLSRPLEPKDCEPLATNLKEVLRAHLQFPGAVPPQIERVRFLDAQLQPFDERRQDL